jgi:dolichyl-phosphate beta-glucosyltransferase
MARPLVSVVVPAFNEEASIGQCIAALGAALDRLGASWELLVVDDGSGDRTRTIVGAAAQRDGRVRLIELPHRGKGSAVRHGFQSARGEWIFMADADLSMPPDNIRRFLAAVSREPVPHIVIGSREAPGSERIGEPWTRHVIGRIFNRVAQAIAVPGIQDTQCGYKLLSADAAAALASHMTLNGFAFDVELLYLARRAGYDVREIGITWHCRTDSRVRIGRGAAAFADVVRVQLNAQRGQYARLLDAGGRRAAPARLDHAIG